MFKQVPLEICKKAFRNADDAKKESLYLAACAELNSMKELINTYQKKEELNVKTESVSSKLQKLFKR